MMWWMFRRVALIALLLVGCTRSEPGAFPPSEPHGGPAASSLLFATDGALLDSGVYATSFNFVYLRDLWVRVQVPQLSKVAMLELTFLNPRGETVFSSTTPFSTDATMSTMTVGGMEYPMAVRQAKPGLTGFLLDKAIPIGGSVFMRNPTPGPWLVTAKVDQQMFTAEIQVSVTP
jgi:hypothetical protein